MKPLSDRELLFWLMRVMSRFGRSLHNGHSSFLYPVFNRVSRWPRFSSILSSFPGFDRIGQRFREKNKQMAVFCVCVCVCVCEISFRV